MSKKRKKRKVRRASVPRPQSSGEKKVGVKLPDAKAFSPDYSYVVSDLKRIGLLAASFIAILILLSFVLR